MANLIELLQSQMTDQVLDTLTSKIGATDRTQTKAAADGIFSTLATALSKNVQKPGGAEGLLGALDRDHDGSIMDDLAGMLGGQKQPQNTSMLNGAGILKHVLGGNQSNVIDMVAKMSGLNQNSSGSLLTMLAPMVLGALGKQKKQNNLDASAITDLLTSSVKSTANNNAQMGMIGKLLDADGDGSVLDDLAGLGKNLLGNLFKK